MSALAGFLQAILDLLAKVAGFVLGWFGGLAETVWGAIIGLANTLLGWLLQLVATLVNLVVDLFFSLLTFAAGLLPPVPSPPQWYSDSIGHWLGLLNLFFPVSESLSIVGAWAAIYGAIWAYKAVKFLRGGG